MALGLSPGNLENLCYPLGISHGFGKSLLLNTLGNSFNSSANGPFSVAMLHFQGAYALYYDYLCGKPK